MFGIRLPLNFHSPYKATNITEFWRRWHMTLSRFLRDYLYIPLGGNRRGRARRYQNLMVTMLLGGLWHGAGWTFVAWGALHGAYLVINHAWHKVRKISGRWLAGPSVVGRFASWMLTFVAVVIGWVFFRASDFDAAMQMLAGMSGLNGISIPNAIYARLGPLADVLGSVGITSHLGQGRQFVFTYLWVIGLLTVALIMPNTQQIMRRYRPALAGHQTPPGAGITIGQRLFRRLFWRPTTFWVVAIGAIAALGFMALTSVSEFLYFQF